MNEIDNESKNTTEKELTRGKYICPYCKSTNCYILTRVVGYFSRVSNWNDSKLAELEDRRKGKYQINTK